MVDIKEIIDAWVVKSNPNKNQLNKSIERANICNVCPSKKVITKSIKLATICGECGCPIGAKIFSLKYNPCPLKKWEEVDKKYLVEEKKLKTFT